MKLVDFVDQANDGVEGIRRSSKATEKQMSKRLKQGKEDNPLCGDTDLPCLKWGTVPPLVKGAIARYYGHVCQYHPPREKRTAAESKPEIDHIVPSKDGGTNCVCNLIFSCFKCNRLKERMPLPPKEQMKALALARQAVPELRRYIQEPAARAARRQARRRLNETSSQRKSSDRRIQSVLRKLYEFGKDNKLCSLRRIWGTTVLLRRNQNRRSWMEGIFLLEAFRCGWEDSDLIVVVGVDYRLDRLCLTPARMYRSSPRRHNVVICSKRTQVKIAKWLEEHKRDLFEDILNIYRGTYGDEIAFKFGKRKLLPQPRVHA